MTSFPWGTLSPKPPGIYRFEVQSCTGKEQAGPQIGPRRAASDAQAALGLLPSIALSSAWTNPL